MSTNFKESVVYTPLKSLDKMEIFSKNIYIYTLIQEEREIMTFPLLIKIIDSRVINLYTQNKTPGPDDFKHDFYQMPKTNISIFYKLFQRIEREETFLIYFMKLVQLITKAKAEQESKTAGLS